MLPRTPPLAFQSGHIVRRDNLNAGLIRSHRIRRPTNQRRPGNHRQHRPDSNNSQESEIPHTQNFHGRDNPTSVLCPHLATRDLRPADSNSLPAPITHHQTGIRDPDNHVSGPASNTSAASSPSWNWAPPPRRNPMDPPVLCPGLSGPAPRVAAQPAAGTARRGVPAVSLGLPPGTDHDVDRRRQRPEPDTRVPGGPRRSAIPDRPEAAISLKHCGKLAGQHKGAR